MLIEKISDDGCAPRACLLLCWRLLDRVGVRFFEDRPAAQAEVGISELFGKWVATTSTH